MDFKANNRKSKAPWQLAPPHKEKSQSNPYADASNASLYAADEGLNDVDEKANDGNFLSVQRSASTKSRKQNRRLSIHASVLAAHGPGVDTSKFPPLPSNVSMYRTHTNNSDLNSIHSYAPTVREKKEMSVVDMIKTELRSKDATAIDDFYKSLVHRKAQVENSVKDRIDENQKNILQLTDNLQITQQQLLSLRVQTKELYGILGEFTEAAERRLELEIAEPSSETYPAKNVPFAPSSKRRDRSSVIVLQKMWAAELQSLYKHVDGAQKFVQAIPDRHILGESGRWHEINVGTWKVSEPVHLFLLNDSILVATRKRSQEGSTKRLQAAHFWPLSAVEMNQINPPSKQGADDTQSYVINLRSNTLSYVYQTDRYDHFTRVMVAFQRGKSEIMQKQRQLEEAEERPRTNQDLGHRRNASATSIMEEGADKRQLRDSLRNSGYMEGKSVSPMGDADIARRSGTHRASADMLLKDISARVHQRNRSHDFSKQERASKDTKNPKQLFTELRTNEDKLDEVDIHLAHNDYMSAVGLIKHIETRLASVFERIQNLNKEDSQAEELRLLVDVVKLKINNRKMKVQDGLQFDLNHTIASLTVDHIAGIVEFYLSFGKLEEGVRAILDALSSQLAKMVGRLTSNAHGSTRVDIVNYLSDLIIVHVSIIKRAVGIHRSCIMPILKRESSKTADSSGFVTWSISEVESLVELIKKHASGSLLVEDRDAWKIKDAKYYEELLRVIESQLILLKKEGLNVDYLFDDITHCAPLAV